MADERNIAVVSYEGGQHLAGIGGVQNDQDIHYLMMEANKDPRMSRMYETYLAGWHNTGSEFFLHYANSGLYTKWGEFLAEPTTAKQAAVETHISTTGCNWSNCQSSTPTNISPIRCNHSVYHPYTERFLSIELIVYDVVCRPILA